MKLSMYAKKHFYRPANMYSLAEILAHMNFLQQKWQQIVHNTSNLTGYARTFTTLKCKIGR